jgi:hypothetical protein
MALIPNKDFSCTSSGCKPLNEAAKKLYARLQTELNRFAAKKGFVPLVPDGIVGPKTAEAAIAVMPESFMSVGSLPFMTDTLEQVRIKQAIAAVAVDPDKFYALALQKGVGLPAQAVPTKPAPQAPMPPSMQPPSPAPPVPPSEGIPTWYWLAGGAGVLAIGAGTYFLLRG